MRIAFADFCRWDFHAQTVDTAPMGGSQSAACHLARCLAKEGHEVFLITQVSTPGIYDGVTSISWKQVDADAAAVRSLQLDVLVCILEAGHGQAMRNLVGPSTRLVLWNQHAAHETGVQPLKDPLERASYDAFAMVSDWQCSQFKKAFEIDLRKTKVMRNAIAPAFANLFDAAESIPSQKAMPPVLAYTSTPYRGLSMLVEAFPRIRAAVPGARLRIFSSMKVYAFYASDDEKVFGDLYHRCREMEGVEYVGSVPQPELARELRGAWMLAYPNIFPETSCISVMEAMAAGCCVVTSKFGALPETCAGFARLIPMVPDKEAYLRQFVDEAVRILRKASKAGATLERPLRRQVDHIHQTTTWQLRARQWTDWLASLT